MKCPVDSIDLIMSERSGVEIDTAPHAAECGWTGASSTRSLTGRGVHRRRTRGAAAVARPGSAAAAVARPGSAAALQP